MNLTSRIFCHHRELRDEVAGRDERLLPAGVDRVPIGLIQNKIISFFRLA